MKRNGYSLICLVFVFMTLILWSAYLLSSGATIYGPRKFIRNKGKPVVVTEKFSAPSATDLYHLVVLNGAKRKNRVSSATLKINGKEILREQDFNQQVDKIERDIGLQTSNSISVELKSGPGSFITVSILLENQNHSPVAQNQSVTTNEDSSKAITLVAADPDGDTLTYQTLTQPIHGSLTGTPPNLTYTPVANYYGPDSFTFKVNDGKVDSNAATVSITVNRPPVAQNQCVTTDEDTAKTITLSASDAESGPLTYTIVTQPEHGTLSGTPPNVIYRPDAHYFGRDTFTFKANDGNADSNVATVSISVTQVIGINVITTVAGNGEASYGGDGGIATKARLAAPASMAVDTAGNLYIADEGNNRVRKVDNSGIVTTVAGIGGIWGGHSGDGAPATQAELDSPSGVAVDTSGNLYIAEYENSSIRKVDTRGIITTVAGGVLGFGGDGGPATEAELIDPKAVAVDNSGNLYIADSGNHRIRKVDTNAIITTVAGIGAFFYGGGYSGDGGPATEARLYYPEAVAVDASGNLYIADWGNGRIRKVGTNGIITTVAGNGIHGYGGDGGPATQAQINGPHDVGVDALGNLYIADSGNNRIRKVGTNGVITTVAGNGTGGYGDDGGPATEAQLWGPSGVAADTSGNLFVVDTGNDRILKVDASGILTIVAGSREYGDGGPATGSNLFMPTGAAIDTCGNLYIADDYHKRIRKVDVDGIITTVAGTAIGGFWGGYSGDGGPATEAELYHPSGVAVDTLGNLYIADTSNNRIRMVDKTSIITTVAGNGDGGFGGDGGPAVQAQLNYPPGVAVDNSGNLYIADDYNHRIRKVDVTGIISTVAGNGIGGYSGDGGPATQAQLLWPEGVAVDTLGNLYIADTYNHRIRKVDQGGLITTIAGNGEEAYGGDGGPALQAQLAYPLDLAVDASGNLYIADYYNNRIRKLDTSGIITTVAGNGEDGYSGDGGPATQAMLFMPQGVAVDVSGNLYIADAENNRIRKVVGISKSATMIGKVTDSSTGLPLADVGITIRDSLNTFQTKTDSNGIYAAAGLRPEAFTATFVKSGYIEQTANGTPVSGQTQTLDIQLTPIPLLTLTITSPLNGAVFYSSPITVEGIVSHNATVTVNQVQASVSNNAFSASVPLNEGPNSIFAAATDQYGQTASQFISVALDTGCTGGIITGTVTDSSTGHPLFEATVSVTDSLFVPQSEGRLRALFVIIGKTARTEIDGRYIISNISPGGFSGTVTKEGYATYNFSGTMDPCQTLTVNAALNPLLPPANPVIDNITVSEVTTNSATISWTTDQMADGSVDYGTTTSHGSSVTDPMLTTSHTIILSNLTPATTYHFKVTSTNGNGLSSTSGDLTFQTLASPITPFITLAITSPSDGSAISLRDIIVRGTVIHSRGSETGVVVNGVLANIYGTEFVANHVPLVEASNTITATATDADGNTEMSSVTVNGVPTTNYISITASTQSGLSPLEATLNLESSLDLTNASLSHTGPDQIEFLSSSASEYRVRMTEQGIYYFTANITDLEGNLYTDTVAITVLSEAFLDGLLRAKWEGMKGALSGKDISKGLEFVLDFSKEVYEQAFNAILDELPQIISDMQDIELIFLTDNVAKYRIDRVHDIDGTPQTITYYIYFVRDSNGLWKIDRF